MDIKSDRNKFETKKNRLKVRDTDIGKKILEQIYDLEELLKIYREDNLIHN
ncbi:fructose-bisphosphatase class III [Eubacterium sp. AF16-48]